MAEVTASFTNRTKQSLQSFGFVIFSFTADIISIVIAVQQQQLGQMGFGILALFLTALTISQILYITRRISISKRNVWPLMVGIIYSAGILALCSRIWSGNNWWQWVLVSLLIPVASLIFVTWKFNGTSHEFQSPFTLDHLGQWFGFAALGLVADILAILGAIKLQDFWEFFAAIGLALTLIVSGAILFITREESRISNQKGPLMMGLFTSAGLTVVYLYVWLDLVLWESLVFNALVMSLALLVGLLRCAMNQPDISTPGAGLREPANIKNPTGKSAPEKSKSSKSGAPKVSTRHQTQNTSQTSIRNHRKPGGDLGPSPEPTNPTGPNPNFPSSPNANLPVYSGESILQSHLQTEVDASITFTVSTLQGRKATASNEMKQDNSVGTSLRKDASRKQSQDNPAVASFHETSKSQTREAEPQPQIYRPLPLPTFSWQPMDNKPHSKEPQPSTLLKPKLELESRKKNSSEGSQKNDAPIQITSGLHLPHLGEWLIKSLFGSPFTQTQRHELPHTQDKTPFSDQPWLRNPTPTNHTIPEHLGPDTPDASANPTEVKSSLNHLYPRQQKQAGQLDIGDHPTPLPTGNATELLSSSVHPPKSPARPLDPPPIQAHLELNRHDGSKLNTSPSLHQRLIDIISGRNHTPATPQIPDVQKETGKKKEEVLIGHQYFNDHNLLQAQTNPINPINLNNNPLTEELPSILQPQRRIPNSSRLLPESKLPKDKK